MAEPGKYALSAPFARLLGEFVVDEQDDTLGPLGSTRLILMHVECGEEVCEIEDADDMAVLVRTVIVHDCGE